MLFMLLGQTPNHKFESLERESARRFVQHLSCFLPVWLECGGHLELDEVVIEFASKFCNGMLYRLSMLVYHCSIPMQYTYAFLIK